MGNRKEEVKFEDKKKIKGITKCIFCSKKVNQKHRHYCHKEEKWLCQYHLGMNNYGYTRDRILANDQQTHRIYDCF